MFNCEKLCHQALSPWRHPIYIEIATADHSWNRIWAWKYVIWKTCYNCILNTIEYIIYRKGYMLEQLVSSSTSASRKNCTKPAQGLRWEKNVGSQLCNISFWKIISHRILSLVLSLLKCQLNCCNTLWAENMRGSCQTLQCMVIPHWLPNSTKKSRLSTISTYVCLVFLLWFF